MPQMESIRENTDLIKIISLYNLATSGIIKLKRTVLNQFVVGILNKDTSLMATMLLQISKLNPSKLGKAKNIITWFYLHWHLNFKYNLWTMKMTIPPSNAELRTSLSS